MALQHEAPTLEEPDVKRSRFDVVGTLPTINFNIVGDSPNEIKIPQQYVGWLKGAHGRQIVDIETKSGAHISIDQNTKELGYSRAILSGSEEAVQMAANIVHNELMRVMERDGYSQQALQQAPQPDEVMLEAQIPQKYVGWLKGSGGKQIRDLETKTGSRIRIDQSTRDVGYSIAQITGTEEAALQVKQFIEAEVARVEERDRVVQAHVENQMPGGVVGEVRIPQQYVGWIKGSGGAQIKDVEARSGAHVTIDQSSADLGYSRAMLYGSAEAVSVAQQYIENELSRVMERDQPGGRVGSLIQNQPVDSQLALASQVVDDGAVASGQPQEALKAVATLLVGVLGAVAGASSKTASPQGQASTVALQSALTQLQSLSASSSQSQPAMQLALPAAGTGSEGDDGTYDIVHLPNACVGWLKGKQGGMIRDIEGRSGAQVDIDQSTKDTGYSCARISASNFHSKKIAHGLVVAEVMKVMDQSGEPCDIGVGVKSEFRIDAQYVGWVKGPRGKVVQDIQVRTGTRIDVDQKNREANIAVVKIFGTYEGTVQARKLIANELSKINPEAASEIVAGIGGLEEAKLVARELPSQPPGAARPPLANPAAQLTSLQVPDGFGSEQFVQQQSLDQQSALGYVDQNGIMHFGQPAVAQTQFAPEVQYQIDALGQLVTTFDPQQQLQQQQGQVGQMAQVGHTDQMAQMGQAGQMSQIGQMGSW
mmetsp:Transcript_102467/g.289425  ORF Transcript_102467/g.289425 Transcript_102467/m.289425 type:complete len:709 (+) Transcript_102467:101-2227(+)